MGRGSVSFGTSVLENFVYLLENFSSASPPVRPLVGQLWFDSSVALLKVYSANAWVPVSDNGTFGKTAQLRQGTMISGDFSSPTRLAGTVGVILVGGFGSTTAAVTFAEGVVISASSEYTIAFADLPPTISVAGFTIPFAGLFPNGLVPGINLSQQQTRLRYAGDTQYADALAAVPYLLSGDDDGSVNALHVKVPATLGAYQRYLAVLTSPRATNTGPATLALNGLPPKPILRLSGAPVAAGDIIQGSYCRFFFDGAAFRLDQMLSYQADAIDQISGIAIQVAGNSASIQNELSVRASATSAIAQQITTLTASVADNTAMIQTVQTASATKTSALAETLTTLSATVNGGFGDITAKYTQLTQAQADQNSSLVQQITNLHSTFGDSTADLYQKLITQTSAASSMTSQINKLVSTTEGNAATIISSYNTLTTADEALSTTITENKAQTDQNIADVRTVAQAATDKAGATATLVQTIVAKYDNQFAQVQNSILVTANQAGQTAQQVMDNTVTFNGEISKLNTTTTNIADENGKLLTQLTVLQQSTGDNNLDYQQFKTAQTTTNGSIYSLITDIKTSYGQNFADINTQLVQQSTATAQVAGRIDSYKTSVDGSLASINQSIQSINGNQVQYQLQGMINGTTGGFSFSGIKTPDGAVYTMTFDSNVRINGSLMVSGSVDYTSIVPGQVQRIAVNTTLYVDSTYGADTYNGSYNLPFRTITACVTYIQNNLAPTGGIVIQMRTPGTYDIPEYFPTIACPVTISGDLNNQGAYAITRGSGQAALCLTSTPSLLFQGLTLINPGVNNLNTLIATAGGQINLSYVTCTVASGTSMGSGNVMRVNPGATIGVGENCIFSGNAPYGAWVVVAGGGNFSTGNASGNNRVVTFSGNPQYSYFIVVYPLGNASFLPYLTFNGGINGSQYNVFQYGVLTLSGKTLPGQTTSNKNAGLIN